MDLLEDHYASESMNELIIHMDYLFNFEFDNSKNMSNNLDELSKIIKNAISANGSGTIEIEKLGGLVALNRLQQSYLPIKTMI